MSKIKSLTDDQMFAAALAYEASGCDLPMEEFLQKTLERYEEIHTIQKKIPNSKARIGSKDKLGL